MNYNRFLTEYITTQQGAPPDNVSSINQSPNNKLDSNLCNFKSKYSFSFGAFCAKQASGPEQRTNLNAKRTLLDASAVVSITEISTLLTISLSSKACFISI